MLPPLSGEPVRVVIRRSLGPHLAATFIRRRVIFLDSEVLSHPGDFERILIHEIFHFAWVRLSNQTRRGWERVIAADFNAPGELGWSAEWRKAKLSRRDSIRRTPAWRRYACESFCDTAACLFAALRHHDEFTISPSARRARKTWFLRNLARPVSI